jgi:glycosyltransferase involved in cell wall biosynthesis
MRILTNFMNSPQFIDLPGGGRTEIVRCEEWHEVRGLLGTADLIVVDCRDRLIYRIAMHFLLFPWKRKPLVAVDLVLRKPGGLWQWVNTQVRRLLFKRVDHFIHYFRDIAGYVFTMGRSLRDYDTYIRAVAELPYPAAIPAFSFDDFEGKDRSFCWNRDNIPRNLGILPDTGSRTDLVRNLAKARLVVIPTQASSLCASGLSTYLDAMHLGKCVIVSHGPGASDLLTEQALLVPPHDVGALREAIARVWEDDALRRGIAAAGRAYAQSLGGEEELLQRVFRQAVTALAR